MIYSVGVVGQSASVFLSDDNGLPVTGKDYLSFPDVYLMKNGAFADVQLPLVSLALITTPWDSGGLKERGRGWYRLDLPDSVFSSPGKIQLSGEGIGMHVVADCIEVSSIFSIIEADQIIDTSVTPWALVYILKGTGGIGVGTELLRKRLHNTAGANLVSTNTVVGQVQQ